VSVARRNFTKKDRKPEGQWGNQMKPAVSMKELKTSEARHKTAFGQRLRNLEVWNGGKKREKKSD